MASPSKNPARRGATTQRSKAPRKPAPDGRIPGWLWGLGGLVAGFFLAHHQHGTAPWQETEDAPQATVISKEQGEGQSESSDDEAASTPTFEFYTLLPETEIIAPDGVMSSQVRLPEPAPEAADEAATASQDESGPGELTADEQAATPDEPIASSTPVSDDDPIAEVIAANNAEDTAQETAQASSPEPDPEPEPAPSAQEDAKRYMLQAASFRSQEDAGRMRDRLRNLSLLAHISEVQANGDTWHRVQVGPYDDPRELNRAQDLMVTQGIEPLLIQLQN